RTGDTGDHREDPRGDVDVEVAQVVLGRSADLERAVRLTDRLLDLHAVVEVAAGEGVAVPQTVDGALVADGSTVGPGAGAQVDDVVGDRDGLGLVLDHEHGVALVPQLDQQVVHPRDVVRVQPDGGLVEDVGDVGQGGA